MASDPGAAGLTPPANCAEVFGQAQFDFSPPLASVNEIHQLRSLSRL
jgi:hypothetical protein